MTDIQVRPLDNHPLIRTRSIDEVRRSLAQIYAEPTVALALPAEALDAHINSYHLQHVSLAYGAYSAAMRLELPPVDRFMQMIPIRGGGEIASGGEATIMAAGDGAVISPDTGYRAHYGADREQLSLKIDATAVMAKLAALTGAAVDRPLRMPLHVDRNNPRTQALHRYVTLLVETLSAPETRISPWWLAQIEQLVMVLFLFGHRHNYSHLLERPTADAALWQVRRAEEYIEAHWQEPVTLEKLAAISGVSTLDLCNTFQKIRGYSPLEFAARVRAAHKGRH